MRIDELVVEASKPGPYPEATIRVDCSSGTYIRTLAADLGTALGGCAHLGDLRRLRVGSFTLDEARPLEQVEADPDAAVVTPAVADARSRTPVARRRRAPRAIAHGATFAARTLVGETRGGRSVRGRRRDRRRCSRSTNDAGAGVKPAVVLATETPVG